MKIKKGKPEGWDKDLPDFDMYEISGGDIVYGIKLGEEYHYFESDGCPIVLEDIDITPVVELDDDTIVVCWFDTGDRVAILEYGLIVEEGIDTPLAIVVYPKEEPLTSIKKSYWETRRKEGTVEVIR